MNTNTNTKMLVYIDEQLSEQQIKKNMANSSEHRLDKYGFTKLFDAGHQVGSTTI